MKIYLINHFSAEALTTAPMILTYLLKPFALLGSINH